MNKTICSLIIGLVMCVFAPVTLARYCTPSTTAAPGASYASSTSTTFGAGSASDFACAAGILYGLAVLGPAEYYTSSGICNDACTGIGYSGSPQTICAQACGQVASSNTVTCLSEGFPANSGSLNGCNSGNDFWGATTNYKCNKACHGNKGPGSSEEIICANACEEP